MENKHSDSSIYLRVVHFPLSYNHIFAYKFLSTYYTKVKNYLTFCTVLWIEVKGDGWQYREEVQRGRNQGDGG